MMERKKTKIIATLGPSCDTPTSIKHLIESGVNVFRFNMKHSDIEWHRQRIKLVEQVSKEMGIITGLFIDLQGPEIRIETHMGAEINLEKDEVIYICSSFDDVSKNKLFRTIRIPYKNVVESFKVGDEFSIDDGFAEFVVVKKSEGVVWAKAKDTSLVKNRKGFNMVGKDVDTPSLTKEDLLRLDGVKDFNPEYVALSFVRTADDVHTLRKELVKRGLNSAIISKVESQKGVDNLDEIIEASDALMVARGDLGVEIPIEKLTHMQKDMVTRCRKASKPVIVATQMLLSMAVNPRPTRAEAADVANAVYDGTDAVMLSNETAAGRFPIRTVETMTKILKFNERHVKTDSSMLKPDEQTKALVRAGVSMLDLDTHYHFSKIVVFTETGKTAQVLAAHRPKIPVIAVSESLHTLKLLTLSYGVVPFISKFPRGNYVYPQQIIKEMIKAGIVHKGEKLLIFHGRKWKEAGKTNALAIMEA